MSFTLSSKDKFIRIEISEKESEAVKIAADNLKKDLNVCYGIEVKDDAKKVIFIGTMEDDSFKWEEYRHEVKGGNLYISGGDRRGTIYGIYALSKLIGVSAWHYFADVPANPNENFSLDEGYTYCDSPTIPYRGIFINDEEELDAWSRTHMNEPTIGVNTYEKVFELILRLKGNYIWPAMHVNSFNMYPECGALAERMGVVVGTSHCDMLMRSNFREWEPWIEKKGYKDAVYDYSFEGRNRDILKEYWRESAVQNKNFEVSYTLGMRGIHDSGFITDALKADSEDELMDLKCRLLEQVIVDQSDILEDVLGRKTLKTFVPYKEVLNLYDRGLKVPEDITLIWTNDNYGYVRRYPSLTEQKREGGNGIYYHCSYWAPTLRHYLFLSSIPVAKTLYEMSKAYENGIRKLWVCNMGAIKPLEQEMEFFISLGWDFGKENAAVMNAKQFLTEFVRDNFPKLSNPERIADLLNRYARVSDVRKVEFMEEDVFAQEPLYNEAAIRLNSLKEIYDELNLIYETVDAKSKDAFFEMILMKVHAAYYTASMYYFADRSNLCSQKKKPGLSNEYTRLSKAFEDLRRKMLIYYNKEMAGGKWDRIVTPEDFPPPRTGMHPASVPGLCDNIPIEKDGNEKPLETVKGYSLAQGKLKDCKLISDLGHGTKDLVEIGDKGVVELEFTISRESKTIIEIHRYPSLNSVEEIFVYASVDDKPFRKLVSESNDEWRGNWQENITNAVDKLYMEEELQAGKHKLTLKDASRYFAASRITVYEDELVPNRLGALEPNTEGFNDDTLPDASYLNEAMKIWYGEMPIEEKVIPVGKFVDGVNVMDLTDDTNYTGNDKDLFMPARILTAKDLLSLKDKKYREEKGAIAMEAFSSYKENFLWEYSTGVTYNRTNLSLYIRERNIHFSEENAPVVNLDFECEGGEYTIYVLMKLDSRNDATFKLFMDAKETSVSWTGNSPWRYESEKPFRYVPMANTKLEKGHHNIALKVYSSCVRIERIILKKVK